MSSRYDTARQLLRADDWLELNSIPLSETWRDRISSDLDDYAGIIPIGHGLTWMGLAQEEAARLRRNAYLDQAPYEEDKARKSKATISSTFDTQLSPPPKTTFSERGRSPFGIFRLVEAYSLKRDMLDVACPSRWRHQLHPYPDKNPDKDSARKKADLLALFEGSDAPEYIKALERLDCGIGKRDYLALRSLLANELIQFATKLLTIANNEILLTTSDRSDSLTRALGTAGQRQLDRYVLFLQAVGNAILVQADELRRREEFIGTIADKDAVEREANAAATALVRLACLNEESGRRGGEIVSMLLNDQGATIPGTKTTRAGSGINFCSTDAVKKRLENTGTTMGVLDALIAELRYQEIRFTTELVIPPEDCVDLDQQKVHLGQRKYSLAKMACVRLASVRVALKTAYEHRAGMVYIRPPGAYLRTSFAASGLQQSANLGWRNMLDEHFWRGQFGVKSPLDLLPGSKRQDREQDRIDTLTEIDKQFWQNINSVRMAGAGNTNYVMVKDDIGNWYAKGLEADPTSIIKGIRANALFALGVPLNANLIQMMSLRDSLNNLDPGDANDAGKRDGLLDQLRNLEERNQKSFRSGGAIGVDESLADALSAFEADFVTGAAGDFMRLNVALAGVALHDGLRAAWNDAVARTPILDDTDRADICTALQPLLRPDGVSAVAPDAARCLPGTGDFPGGFDTVRAPMEAVRASGDEELDLAVTQSQAMLKSLSALIDYRADRLTLLKGLDLPGRLARELTQASTGLETARSNLAENERSLGDAKNVSIRAVEQRDLTRRLKGNVPDDAACDSAGDLGDTDFIAVCNSVADAEAAVVRLESNKVTLEAEVVRLEVARTALVSRVAIRQHLASALSEAFDTVIGRVLSEYLDSRERANQDLERAVEVFSTASGVVAP